MDNLSFEELEQLLGHLGASMDLLKKAGYTAADEQYARMLTLNMRVFCEIGNRYQTK